RMRYSFGTQLMYLVDLAQNCLEMRLDGFAEWRKPDRRAPIEQGAPPVGFQVPNCKRKGLFGKTPDRKRPRKLFYIEQRQKVFDLCQIHKANPLSEIEAHCHTLTMRSRLSCGSLRERLFLCERERPSIIPN